MIRLSILIVVGFWLDVIAIRGAAAQVDYRALDLELIRADTMPKLIALASRHSDRLIPHVETLWIRVLGWSLRPEFEEETYLHRHSIRLAALATILELQGTAGSSKIPKQLDLASVDSVSLKALSANGVVSTKGSLRDYLETAPPIVELRSTDGGHQYRRIDIDTSEKVIRFEKCDVQHGQFGPQWLMQSGPSTGRIRGRFFNFPLVAINFYNVAAKAYLFRYLLPETSKARASLSALAAMALHHAGKANPDGGATTALFPLKSAISELKSIGGSSRAVGVLERFYATSCLRSGQLARARNAFGEQLKSLNVEDAYHIYANLRLGVIAEGLGSGGSKPYFKRALDHPEFPDRPEFIYWLVAYVHCFGDDRLDAADRQKLQRFQMAPDRQLSGAHRHVENLAMLQDLLSSGNEVAAVKLLIRELREFDRSGIKNIRWFEARYLTELGACLHDVFRGICWKRDRNGDLVLRSSDSAYLKSRFAPTEVVNLAAKDRASEAKGGRYGAISPEEDEATCLELYHPEELREKLGQMLASTGVPFDPRSISVRPSKPAADFAEWVTGELQRCPPVIEPLLKLVWIEWFYLPLMGIENHTEVEWSYRPVNHSGLTSPDHVRDLLANATLGDGHAGVWATFLSAREYLEKRHSNQTQ